MYLLRRTAARAISASPSKALFTQPRSIATFTPAAFRTRQQQWSIAAFQKRFASDDASQAAASDAPENFAQTATEAPVEENLTPAQAAVQAEPTDASATIGIDALDAAAKAADSPRSDQRRSRERTTPAEPNTMLYIGNLYYEVTTDQLKRVFSRFGEIESVKLVYDNRGLSRGFGYVEFKSVADAQTAVDNLDMQVFEGRNLVVQFHRPKTNSKTLGASGSYESNPPSKTLFIGNMSFEMSDKDLNDLFRDIRNVMDVRVAIDRRTGQPRGFAHADFIDVASATQAREVLKEKTIYGRQLRVDFSRSGAREGGDRDGDRGGRRDGGDRYAGDRGGRGDRGDRGDREDRRDRRRDSPQE
ncbi:RNA-binding domain-containing protein [Dothidotthia symphoricarpi CBS 119687]|uniref:RNA-binding domain-containing protein n=1 Tax=Dothidotthia symphoricarpi CBS 119687 TaxID=1392245 RepID=A0A6A6AN16_9PLEO|nr:RNA-binding domain-containing protein [Dothidotthia symphoricarpi CBS 119687]KAF2132956.1 RNA-binding domain-containing protein [Dothidotthia symphoricarpi CBS 119687]